MESLLPEESAVCSLVWEIFQALDSFVYKFEPSRSKRDFSNTRQIQSRAYSQGSKLINDLIEIVWEN